MAPSIAIVGAGPTGLATAAFLRWRLGDDASITVIDATDAPGGKVRTVMLAGLPVDTGPDSLLSRGVELQALIERLGLTGEIIEPLPGGAFIWSRGQLRPIPQGAAFGLPDRLVPILRSGLLTPAGTLRAAVDFIRPRTKLPADPTIGEIVRPRYGTEVYERMVEPLLGGIHAGSPDVLSATSTVPEIAALARTGRSITLTMRKRRKAAPAPTAKRPAPLVSIRGGLGTLTSALIDVVGAGNIRTGAAVTGLNHEGSGRWTVAIGAGELAADAVVIATPAYVAADLVGPHSSRAGEILRGIPYVDVANATLAYRRSDVPADLRGTGFLVPPVEGDFIVGCTWLTSKWPHLANDDVVLIKSMVGRWGDDRWLSMDDDQLVAAVRDDLARIVGISAEPFDRLVQRWPGAMPQYVVGHAARLDELDRELADFPGLFVTGSAYRGSGIAACIAQAQATAERIPGASD